MYFTTVTTKASALAIVAMAASHFALIRVAAAPVTLSQADYLRNGQDAQKLNKQFESVNVEDPCNAGEKACIGGNFAVCSPENDWEVTPCPESLQCFAVPTKTGTTISCATKDDAKTWIADTGAKGGINGDDSSSDDNNNNEGDGDKVSSTLGTATTTSAVETGTSTDLSTVTSTPAASDIPGISIPLGDAFSDKLSTTTTDADAATSTSSGTETTDFPTAIAPSTTCSTSTVTDASDCSDSTSAASSAASGRFTTRLTTTVIVTATECSTTDVSESSLAQGTATAPNVVTFTTHPFSPIPVSTSASTVDDAISSSSGYIIGSTSSSEAPVATTAPTQSVSFITQTGTQSFPIGGTISTITLSDSPAEPAPSSVTGDAPAYSYSSDAPAYSYSNDAPAYSYSYSSESSIPLMNVAATPAVIVLPPHFTPA